MELEGIMLSEISQGKKNTLCYHLYAEYKERNRLTDIENKLVVTSGEKEKGTSKIGVWAKRYKLLYIK